MGAKPLMMGGWSGGRFSGRSSGGRWGPEFWLGYEVVEELWGRLVVVVAAMGTGVEREEERDLVIYRGSEEGSISGSWPCMGSSAGEVVVPLGAAVATVVVVVASDCVAFLVSERRPKTGWVDDNRKGSPGVEMSRSGKVMKKRQPKVVPKKAPSTDWNRELGGT